MALGLESLGRVQWSIHGGEQCDCVQELEMLTPVSPHL